MDQAFKIEEVKNLRGYAVEWANSDELIVSRRNVIYKFSIPNGQIKKIVSVKAPLWKELFSRTRIFQRLLRFMITNVVCLKNGDFFVTFDKSVGIIRNETYFEIPLERPCRVLRSACALDEQENIFFGEYLSNPSRESVRIYRYSPREDSIEVVYDFPSGSIRHVHGIYFDDFSGRMFCLTGDKAEECRILSFSSDFRDFDVIGEGDETWRAVSIVFDKDAFYYGTDAEFRKNYIYKVERSTGEREVLCEVDGTVYYSKRLGEWIFFTTTAENAPSQKENVASIWGINTQTNECKKLLTFRKDFWNGTLFMFGTIHFPFSIKRELYFHLVALRGDGKTFKVVLQ
ncbi:MAG: hypothetical protein N2Z23_03055 [Pyrinomonadaceae bacterium]|nr:hypothetical protein [Pyrinomonadaceae bacterium]MCX7639406.1 hypothetical protein [Pyrinomonadaceae bacterium]MDW8304544.1 hypothetical protein [Acidobacteriota bacterium]